MAMPSLQLTFVPVGVCYVCGETRHVPAFIRESYGYQFHWVRCASCHLLYQDPKLSRESLNDVYNSPIYWQHDGQRTGESQRLGYQDYTAGDSYRLRQAQVRLKTVLRYLAPNAKVLDVACATGSFVKVARNAGVDATGIDLSAAMVGFGKQAYGIPLTVGDFDSAEIAPASLDGVTIWGADSNFFDPRFTLTRAHSVLRPGGYLFFNFWDFDHVSRPLRGSFKLGCNALYNFNRSNIVRLLSSIGFETSRMTHEWQYATLDAVLFMTDHPFIRALVHRLGWADRIVRLPTLSGFVVVARKHPEMAAGGTAR